MKKILFALLIFIAITQALDVNVIGTCGAGILQTIKDEAGGILVLLMLSIVITLALVYMFANAFHRPEYLVLVKDEFFHLGISLCVLIFFGTVMTLSCGIMHTAFNFAYSNVNAAVNNPCDYGTVQRVASCYMGLMEKDAENIIKKYTVANINLQTDAAKVISYFGIIGGATFGPDAYKRTWATFVDTVNHMFVLPAYISIKMQNLIVKLFLGDVSPIDNPYAVTTRSTVLSLILPGAFILRFFPPTRQMGNMLIALAVGIYLIIPVFLALNGMMYAHIFTPEDCANYSWLLDDKISGIGGCDSDINFLAVARLYPQAFLLPNLTIVIFITFVSSINKALKVIG